MSYNANINTSLHGRRIGLQLMTSAVTGSGRALAEQPDMIVGPEDIRKGVSASESTSVNLKAFGVSRIQGTSAASTLVFTLDPPIPGVEKTLFFESTDSALYVKTGSGENITGSSIGTSATAVVSSGGGTVRLVGVTTALWGALNVSSSAVNTLRFQATT